MKEHREEHWYPRKASDAWDRGFSVVRLQEPRQGNPDTGKATAGRWKNLQTVRLTKREAEAITGQYGIITGAVSGVVVVDVDREDLLEMVLQELANTPMRTRTRQGWHLYYRHPGVEVRNRAKLRKLPLDVRGDGGYVVGPGSLHWSGRRYEAEGDWSSVENLPEFDLSWLDEERKYERREPQQTTLSNFDRAALWLAATPGAISKQGGHNLTFRVACRLTHPPDSLNAKKGGFGLSVDQALPLMLVWNAKCEPPWSLAEIRHKLEDSIRVLSSKRSDIIKTIGG